MSWRWPATAAAAYVALLTLTLTGWGPLVAADHAVADALRRYGAVHPQLIAVVRVVTDVAATIPFLAAGSALALFLWVRRRRPAARFVALVTVGIPTLWSMMHVALRHPRPVDAFVAVHSNSFPSGHTANAAAATLVVVHLLPARLSRATRVVTTLLLLMFSLLVGLTRLILLAHWPSDVLGGLLLAAAVVPTLARLVAGTERPGTQTR